MLLSPSGSMLPLRWLEISASEPPFPLRKLPLRFRLENACLRLLLRGCLFDLIEAGLFCWRCDPASRWRRALDMPPLASFVSRHDDYVIPGVSTKHTRYWNPTPGFVWTTKIMVICRDPVVKPSPLSY